MQGLAFTTKIEKQNKKRLKSSNFLRSVCTPQTSHHHVAKERMAAAFSHVFSPLLLFKSACTLPMTINITTTPQLMPVRHVMPQAAEHLASKIADDHAATIRRRAPRTASCQGHASMQNLLSLAHLALVLLFLCCKPASSIEPINPFVGTPIIVDHAPEYSTPSASPAEHVVQSNEVMRVFFHPLHMAAL